MDTWVGETSNEASEQSRAESSFHHELELEADLIAMRWAASAGLTAADAANALARAYNGSAQVFSKHPSFKVRSAALMSPQ